MLENRSHLLCLFSQGRKVRRNIWFFVAYNKYATNPKKNLYINVYRKSNILAYNKFHIKHAQFCIISPKTQTSFIIHIWCDMQHPSSTGSFSATAPYLKYMFTSTPEWDMVLCIAHIGMRYGLKSSVWKS